MNQVIINFEYEQSERRKQKNQQRLQSLKPFYMNVLDLIEFCGGSMNGYSVNGAIGYLAGQLATELYSHIYKMGTNFIGPNCIPSEKANYPIACINGRERKAIIITLKENGHYELADVLREIYPIYEPATRKDGAAR